MGLPSNVGCNYLQLKVNSSHPCEDKDCLERVGDKLIKLSANHIGREGCDRADKRGLGFQGSTG